MKPITKEWVAKAESDFHTVQREMRARKNPNLDAACFHAQQCIEKYLKGRLQEAGIVFPKTHDLANLLGLVAPVEPLWMAFLPGMKILSNYAVEARYPGRTISRTNAREAFALCRQFRTVIRQSLGLP